MLLFSIVSVVNYLFFHTNKILSNQEKVVLLIKSHTFFLRKLHSRGSACGVNVNSSKKGIGELSSNIGGDSVCSFHSDVIEKGMNPCFPAHQYIYSSEIQHEWHWLIKSRTKAIGD